MQRLREQNAAHQAAAAARFGIFMPGMLGGLPGRGMPGAYPYHIHYHIHYHIYYPLSHSLSYYQTLTIHYHTITSTITPISPYHTHYPPIFLNIPYGLSIFPSITNHYCTTLLCHLSDCETSSGGQSTSCCSS